MRKRVRIMISIIIRKIRQFGLYLWNTFRRHPFTPQKRGPRLIMESALDYNEDGELESYWPEFWPVDMLIDQARARGQSEFEYAYQNNPVEVPVETPEQLNERMSLRVTISLLSPSLRSETFDELRRRPTTRRQRR